MNNWESKPYIEWLEGIIKELVDIDPECIALEMLDADGKVYTCYWNISSDDRARLIGGMQDDDRMEWLKANRDLVASILDGEVGDDE